MSGVVPFHFILLAVGELLKSEKTVNAQQLQDFIQKDENFSVRPPLEDCRLAMQLLAEVGFIEKVDDKDFKRFIPRL